jgi:hypothetical protein
MILGFSLMRKDWLACILLTLFCLAAPGLAQGDRGTITGIVTDATQAAVPDVEITVTHAATGVRTTTRTGPTGSYTLLRLPIGTYTLTARKEGFRTYEQTGDSGSGRSDRPDRHHARNRRAHRAGHGDWRGALDSVRVGRRQPGAEQRPVRRAAADARRRHPQPFGVHLSATWRHSGGDMGETHLRQPRFHRSGLLRRHRAQPRRPGQRHRGEPLGGRYRRVQADHQQLLGRVHARPRRRHFVHDEKRHQRAARQRLLVQQHREVQRALLLRRAESALQAERVGRHHRRADLAGQAL